MVFLQTVTRKYLIEWEIKPEFFFHISQKAKAFLNFSIELWSAFAELVFFVAGMIVLKSLLIRL